MKIFENSSNKCHLRRFIWAVLSRIFYFSIEIDALVAERRCKFYSIPSFRRYRIQPNLYSVGDSRGKPEGPNIIPGTRGSRYAWDPTCIHFPNRRVNVKNTARVFSRRVRVEKKEKKRHRKERSRDENVRGIRRFEKVLEKVSSNDFFHIWKWILDDN